MTTRARLVLMILLVIGAVFTWMVRWFLADLRPRYLETMEESLVETAVMLAASLSDTAPTNGAVPVDGLRRTLEDARRRAFSASIYNVTKTNVALRVYVTDARGIVVFDSDGGRAEGQDYSRWNDVLLCLQGRYGARTTRSEPGNLMSSVLYVAAPILVDGRIAGVLSVGKPAASIRLFLETARRNLITVGAVAGVIAILIGIAVSFWITRPIEALTRYARAIRDGKRPPPPPTGRGEIGRLTRAFEEMRESLEGKQYVESYIQALTHEMKSPIAAIRGAAELLSEDMPAEDRRRFTDNIRGEAARMQDLVDRLLQLSELERRKGLSGAEPVDLHDLAADAARSFESIVRSRRIALSVEVPRGTRVRGERFLLRQALANLLQNAADFTPAGGQIRLRGETANGWVQVTVEDNGPGIPDYALSRIFERFYSLPRPDTEKKSSGLGLPLVQEVAHLHQGTIAVENRSGGGVRATLRLPLAPG